MIDVVFSDDEKELIKIVTRDVSDDKNLNRNEHDIISLGYALDIGDISDEINSFKRKNSLEQLWKFSNYNDNEIEEYLNLKFDDINKLIYYARNGIEIRVWKSDAPYSACGYAYLCYLLRNINCKITVISLPRYMEIGENIIVSYSGWGEISPEQINTFLSFKRVISNIEKEIQSNIWKTLKRENTILRAVVNGTLISVPENFYDHIISRNIPDDEFLMVKLIGKLIGEYQLGVSDSWYAMRINNMIDKNKLTIISETNTKNPYHMILKKV